MSKNNILCNGIIKWEYIFEHWDTPCIVNDEETICPLLRVQELVINNNRKLNVRYWLTDKPTSLDDAKEGAVRTAMGLPTVELDAETYSYSEYTSGVDYESELKIGGHDLHAELRNNIGKYIWLEIESI